MAGRTLKERLEIAAMVAKDRDTFEYRVDEYADAVRLRRPHWSGDQFDMIPMAEWEGLKAVLSRWFRMVELGDDD